MFARYSSCSRILVRVWAVYLKSQVYNKNLPLREKCPYLEIFWSVYSRIWIEYRELLCKSPYSVHIPEHADQKNLAYQHFVWSVFSMLSLKTEFTKDAQKFFKAQFKANLRWAAPDRNSKQFVNYCLS